MEPSGLVTTSEYIPKREALLVKIDMSDYLIDYYLHRKDHAPDTLPAHDEQLKTLIACFAIHLSARTARETHAWTAHVADSLPYSLFVTGDTGEIDASGIAKGFLVGHVLTENIRLPETHSLHAQVSNRGKTYNSMVQCDTPEITAMVTQFYAQSEGYPIRLLLSKTSDTALGLVALPEYDADWCASVDIEELASSTTIEKSFMRTCQFRFECDCSPDKLLPFFRSMDVDSLEELYGEDTELHISCPRCGKQFSVNRSEVAN